MNYDNEIDLIEEKFRKPGFQETLSKEEIAELETNFFEMTKKMYTLNKLEKEDKNSQEITKLRKEIDKELIWCKKACGLIE